MHDDRFERFLYRRQYIVAPYRVSPQEGWKQIELGNGYILNAQPDLPLTAAHHQGRSIYMLGYILDSSNPSFNDTQIMQNVIERSKNADDVFSQLAEKCGRFVIIVRIEDSFRIFSDACGLRQIFYHIDDQGKVWCASQPHLIAKARGIAVNETVALDLRRTSLFKGAEHWFPGNVTLFDKIQHLIPNHFVDMKSGCVSRYWPTKRLPRMSVSECVPLATEVLEGIVQAATSRFNLACAISCGLDSRTLLSASRKYAGQMQYFTQTRSDTRDRDPDVLIPIAMLKKLGLRHSVLVLDETLDEEFDATLKENVMCARPTKGLNAKSIHNYFNGGEREVVVMYGNCSEITKRDRFRFPKALPMFLGGRTLSAMAEMAQSEVARRQFAHWATEAKQCVKYNLDMLDLMHWEQRVGNWAAMTLTEYEMVFESLCPYSCRRYIELMLSVPFKYRTRPGYLLHHEIIRTNWPDLLDYEINPGEGRISKFLVDWMYRTSLYDVVKLLYIMCVKRFRR
jgi:hypothetical protein